MSGEAASLLLGLLLAHYLGDFTPLASERVQRAKATGGPLLPIVGHAAVHGLLTGVAAGLIVRPGWTWLAGAAGIVFLSHLLIDVGRSQLTARISALRSPDRQLFWVAMGADQLAHVAILVGLTALLV